MGAQQLRNAEGHVTYANPAAMRILKIPPGASAARILDLLPKIPEDREDEHEQAEGEPDHGRPGDPGRRARRSACAEPPRARRSRRDRRGHGTRRRASKMYPSNPPIQIRSKVMIG